jgi:hypothetical protein
VNNFAFAFETNLPMLRPTKDKDTMKKNTTPLLILAAGLPFAPLTATAWDYEGHRIVNQIAIASLPTNFPAFVFAPEARERIAFLAGEPDRWRNTQDHTFNHYNAPDHFMDMDYLENFGMKPETTSPFRYEFVSQLAAARVKQPDIEPVANPEKDVNKTQSFFGFLPWAINEYYSKLKAEFSYLKAFEKAGGTADEIRNAQENIIYTMGVMGHYVGDGSQPLHTTKHFNGWSGANTNGYTTSKKIHGWIDGGYLLKVGTGMPDLLTNTHPAQVIEVANSKNEGIFQPVMKYLAAQNQLVEPLYQLEKDGKLSGDGTVGLEGKKFIQGQILTGGQMLGDIWLTAWQTAPVDDRLLHEIEKRNAPAKSPTAESATTTDAKPAKP